MFLWVAGQTMGGNHALLELSAIFETWHLADGNYPPFYKGMAVYLAFQAHMQSSLLKTPSKKRYFNHLGDAEYDFCGEVLYLDKPTKQTPLAVIDVGGFRFYIQSAEVNRLRVGKTVKGNGTLLLDYYIWVEFYSKLKNVPDIFYSFDVTRIRQVKIPDRFTHQHNEGIAHPSYVARSNFEDIKDLETMEGQKFDKKFYIVDFKLTDRNDLPRTFLF